MPVLRPDPTPFTAGSPEALSAGYRWPGEGRTVVLLHGFGGCALDFEALVPHLPRDTDLIALDLVGHGALPVPPRDAFTMQACVARVQAALHTLGITRPHLLGYSMGGRTALHLATAAPTAFSTLTLVGATAGLADPAERAARRAWDREIAAEARTLGPVDFAARWAQVPLIRSQKRIPAPWGALLRARRRGAQVEGLARSMEGMGTGSMPSLWARLDTLQMPALITVGEHDSKYRLIAPRMVAEMSRAQLGIIEGAGHAAHLEAPTRFAGLWRPWLDEVSPRC